jgi:N-acetyl-1-D-myo-inositol-2-amino-2-deoxy-alpha-D-glucopyranoside deacetylase
MKPGILFVHAHPDDETINNGATMAKYVAKGHRVTLVTCTAGEEGEVLVPELSHLVSAQTDALGPERQKELANAMAALGVTDHLFLGGFGEFRDSGMMGTNPNNHPKAFWQADLLKAATELVRIIRDRKPAVLVTYDEFGGYGHPDHIQTHRVAMYAAALAAAPTYLPELPAWQISKIYWNAAPREIAREQIEALHTQGIETGMDISDIERAPYFCDDALVTTRVDASEFAERKFAALRCHRTQLDLESGYLAAIGQAGTQAAGIEYYRLVAGGVSANQEMETDLFAGLEFGD